MTYRIKELPSEERPRERLLRCGPDSLRNAELIAILLRTGVRGHSSTQLAEELLGRFRNLNELARAGVDELRSVRGVGLDKAVTLKGAFALAGRLAAERPEESPLVDTPERVADLLREACRSHSVECLKAVLLNARHRLIRVETISQGTLDTLLVHPREVFRRAILANAAALVLAHNHPSGDPTPSEADIRVTRELRAAGRLLKIELLDHVILGRATSRCPRDFASLREMGCFD